MTDPRYEILESCLQALKAGANLQELISEHPDLYPALEAAHEANQLSDTEIPAQVVQRSRTRVLSHAATLRASQPASKSFFARLPRVAIAGLIALFVFLSWSSLLVASAGSLPGDQLYPVKRVVEDLRLNLSFDRTQQQHIETQYQERRIEEVRQLLVRQRTEVISFEGIVAEQGVRHWVVAEILVIVAPETVIIGEIEPGMLVEVEGLTQPQGWVQAVEIHLREFEFLGVVESRSHQVWIISGQQVRITPETRLDPQIQIGDQVQILVQSDDNGILYAIDIGLIAPGASVTPAPTKTPLPTIDTTADDQDGDSEQTLEPTEEQEDENGEEDEVDESEDHEKEEDEAGKGESEEDPRTEDGEDEGLKEEEESETEKEDEPEREEEEKETDDRKED